MLLLSQQARFDNNLYFVMLFKKRRHKVFLICLLLQLFDDLLEGRNQSLNERILLLLWELFFASGLLHLLLGLSQLVLVAVLLCPNTQVVLAAPDFRFDFIISNRLLHPLVAERDLFLLIDECGTMLGNELVKIFNETLLIVPDFLLEVFSHFFIPFHGGAFVLVCLVNFEVLLLFVCQFGWHLLISQFVTVRVDKCNDHG